MAYISHTFPPAGRPLANVGGMQRVATELAQALGARSDIDLVPVVLRSAWWCTCLRAPAFLVGAAWRTFALARRTRIDAVLFSSVVSAALLWPLLPRLRRRGVRCVAIAHGQDVLWPWPLYQSLARRALRRLDAVAAVSRATGRACLERGLAPDRLRVIPNGVDATRFPARPGLARARTAARVRRAAVLSADAFVLCSVGRHVRRKGYLWFVREVMPLLPAQVHYCLAGDGPDTSAVARMVGERGLEARVRLTGRLTEAELVELYLAADLFVMPNVPVSGTMEGFGVVLVEAALCGLPAVATRLEGIQDVVTHRESGLLVDSHDPAGFAAAIRECMDDPQQLARLAGGALRAARRLTWERVASAHLEGLRTTGRRGEPASASARA